MDDLLKALLDYGLGGLLLIAGIWFVMRPPHWVTRTVDAHHQLAMGVRELSATVAAIPKREEIQDLQIGQEAIRREIVEARQEWREIRAAIQRDLRSEHGRSG